MADKGEEVTEESKLQQISFFFFFYILEVRLQSEIVHPNIVGPLSWKTWLSAAGERMDLEMGVQVERCC